MKQLSNLQMNAVMGGIGPKASVSTGITSLVEKNRWEQYWDNIPRWEPPMKFQCFYHRQIKVMKQLDRQSMNTVMGGIGKRETAHGSVVTIKIKTNKKS